MESSELLALLTKLEELKQQVSELKQEVKPLHKPENKYRSEDIKEITAALAKARPEFRTIYKNRQNSFFKSEYADIDAIIPAVVPSLSKNGLFLKHHEEYQESGALMLWTELYHTSGQWFGTEARIVPKNTEQQEKGKAITYQRRYSIMLLLGLTISNDNDDDDDAYATEKSVMNDVKQGKKVEPDRSGEKLISKEQVDMLQMELESLPGYAEKLLKHYDIESLADIKISNFYPLLEKVRTMKINLKTAKE